MRHLNGVYTQRYNRTEKTDGPLYRGRYKAILIDADACLLNVSRYIHRNPLEAGVVKRAEDYPWFSYGAYIGLDRVPPWLSMAETLGMIGQRNLHKRHQIFVEAGVDDEPAVYSGEKLENQGSKI